MTPLQVFQVGSWICRSNKIQEFDLLYGQCQTDGAVILLLLNFKAIINNLCVSVYIVVIVLYRYDGDDMISQCWISKHMKRGCCS